MQKVVPSKAPFHRLGKKLFFSHCCMVVIRFHFLLAGGNSWCLCSHVRNTATWGLTKELSVFLTGLHESLQPCSRAARKWRENEEMRRKWRENEEMERDWLSTFPHSLSISSLFLHFLPLFPFPTSKCITFCCKMLNTALLSRMSQKSQHTRYEEIILGRTCCEEAPQFVSAWRWVLHCPCHIPRP